MVTVGVGWEVAPGGCVNVSIFLATLQVISTEHTSQERLGMCRGHCPRLVLSTQEGMAPAPGLDPGALSLTLCLTQVAFQ